MLRDRIHRVRMFPAVPLAAAVCGAVVVFGLATAGSWVADEWADFTDSGPRRTSQAIDAAFDKVLSERDWSAAGLPAGATEFEVYRFPQNAPRFKSLRRIGDEHRMAGSLVLWIGTADEMTALRRKVLNRVYDSWIKLGEEFESGASESGRSWHVFARHFRADKMRYWELVGLCFHDGVYVKVRFEDWATKEQAAGFQRMIQGAADRLPAVCDADLRPYIDRAAAGGKSAR